MDEPRMIHKIRYGLEVSLRSAQGGTRRDLVLIWEGYLEGLREFGVISEETYDSLQGLLPTVDNNPIVQRAPFSLGWADSWDDSPIGG
jgi:hypothetical protein